MNQGLLGFAKKGYTPGIVYLGKRIFRNNAAHTFVKEFSPDIDEYRIVMNNLVQSVAANVGAINGSFSVNHGASFDNANNYVYAAYLHHLTNIQMFGLGPGNSFFMGNPDNDAGYGSSGIVRLFLNDRGLNTQFTGEFFSRDINRATNDPQGVRTAGAYLSSKRINGINVGISSGVIVSGEMRLYGMFKG